MAITANSNSSPCPSPPEQQRQQQRNHDDQQNIHHSNRYDKYDKYDKYNTIRSSKSNKFNLNLNLNSNLNPNSSPLSLPRGNPTRTRSASPSSDHSFHSNSDSHSSQSSISKRRRTSRDTLFLDDPSDSNTDTDRPTSWTSMADTTCDNPQSESGQHWNQNHKRSSSISIPQTEDGDEEVNHKARSPSPSSSSQDLVPNMEEQVDQLQSSSFDSSFDKRLDSLLNATMIALEASNSLLLSTLEGRSDLARFRAAENSLEELMDSKEIELKCQLENTFKLSQFVDKASKKLDDLLEAEKKRSGNGRSVQIIPGWGLGFGSRLVAGGNEIVETASSSSSTSSPTSHWRSPSIGKVESVSGGIRSLKSNDEDATIGKSAAKRLEKVLKSSQEAQEKVQRDQISSSTSTMSPEEEKSTMPSHSRKPSLAARDVLGAIAKRDSGASSKRTASANSSITEENDSSPIPGTPSSSSSKDPSSLKGFTFPTTPNRQEEIENSNSNSNLETSNQTTKIPVTPSPHSSSLLMRTVSGGRAGAGRIKLGQSTPSTPSTSIDNGSARSPLNETMNGNSNPEETSKSPRFPPSPSPPNQHRRPESRSSSLASIEESSHELKSGSRPQDYFSGSNHSASKGHNGSSRNTSVSSLSSIGGLSIHSSNSRTRLRSPLIPWNDAFDLGIGTTSSTIVSTNLESSLDGEKSKRGNRDRGNFGLADALGIYDSKTLVQDRDHPKASIATAISNSDSNSSIKSTATTISPENQPSRGTSTPLKADLSNSNFSKPTPSPISTASTSFNPTSTPTNQRRISREFSFGHSKSPSLLNGPNSPSAALSSSYTSSPFEPKQDEQTLRSSSSGNGGRSKGRNGALEALKRLNEQTNDRISGAEILVENENTATNGNDPGSNQPNHGGGWGGFGLASWIGFGNENPKHDVLENPK